MNKFYVIYKVGDCWVVDQRIRDYGRKQWLESIESWNRGHIKKMYFTVEDCDSTMLNLCDISPYYDLSKECMV